ncbi:MAG: hypothetical protein ACREXY_08620 [Gammaproteobacteria bacterium]
MRVLHCSYGKRTLDTQFIERLQAAGVPEAQAKALAEAQKDVFAEALRPVANAQI